jgi:hypothetical protein
MRHADAFVVSANQRTPAHILCPTASLLWLSCWVDNNLPFFFPAILTKPRPVLARTCRLAAFVNFRASPSPACTVLSAANLATSCALHLRGIFDYGPRLPILLETQPWEVSLTARRLHH